jgi:hypothetical protein
MGKMPVYETYSARNTFVPRILDVLKSLAPRSIARVE